tara:strand:+ start:1288 stop:1731 length:444 start_codon:yes stop_codon:yes gene_type:complete
MALFAELTNENIVSRVVVVKDSDTSYVENSTKKTVIVEEIGISNLQRTHGEDSIWKLTTDNDNFRGRYAGIGMTYMENVSTLGVASTDIFIPQRPYNSWNVGINTVDWYPPIPEPALTDDQIAAGSRYEWDEAAYQADNTVGWALTT